MTALLLLLIGLPVGFLLDTLAVYLVSNDDGEVDLTEPQREPGGGLAADTGAIVPAVLEQDSRWRRPVLTLGLAALFAVAGARYTDPLHLALTTLYIAVFVLAATTDLMAFRVPNVATYPAILLALAAGVLMPGANQGMVIAGGAFAGGILLLPALLTGGNGLGMGDVKLAAFVGLALGLQLAVPALLIMALSGGAAALVLLASRRRHRRDPIPYAPFISAGAIAVMLWQGTAFHLL